MLHNKSNSASKLLLQNPAAEESNSSPLEWFLKWCSIRNVLVLAFVLQILLSNSLAWILLTYNGQVSIMQQEDALEISSLNHVTHKVEDEIRRYSNVLRYLALSVNQMASIHRSSLLFEDANREYYWVRLLMQARENFAFPASYFYVGEQGEMALAVSSTKNRVYYTNVTESRLNGGSPIGYLATMDLDSYKVISARKQNNTSNFKMQPYYIATRNRLRSTVNLTTLNNHGWSVVATIPVSKEVNFSSTTSSNESFMGVVGVEVSLESLNAVLAKVSERVALSFILDLRDGKLVASSSGPVSRTRNETTGVSFTPEPIKGIESNHSVIRAISEQIQAMNYINNGECDNLRQGNIQITIDGINYRFAFTVYHDVQGFKWMSIVAVQKNSFINLIASSSALVLIVTLLVLTFGTVIVCAITNCITHPLYKISQQMMRIANMNLDVGASGSKLLKYSPLYEVRDMQRSISIMRDALVSFQKYIPSSVVSSIMQSRQQAELQMKLVQTTVMFVDIQDFTKMTDDYTKKNETEKIETALKEFFEISTRLVESRGGIVDKFTGDGFLALFNTPEKPMANDAIEACALALELIEELSALCSGVSWKMAGLPDLKIRVGINTGPCHIGNIGSSSRFNYTAIGDTVNLASRFESLNKDYHTNILIGEETYKLAKYSFLCYFVDVAPVKGREHPCAVYTVKKDRKQLNLEETQSEELMLRTKYLNDTDCEPIWDKVLEIQEQKNDAQFVATLKKLKRRTMEVKLKKMTRTVEDLSSPERE